MRKILHIDMDAFYASVEQRDDPALRGRPVVVAWRGGRSVVVAASYEARPFGVRSAMPAARAERLCPDAVFIPPDFPRYKAVSRQVRAIFHEHTDLVEPLSLDEAYLDVTEPKIPSPSATESARMIRARIREVTGLTASAGAAPNKFLAKIASDWNKPDGLFVISPARVEAFLTPLPVSRIPGVGKVMQARLEGLGVRTVGELRALAREELQGHFGSFGLRLYERARGIDERPVQPDQPVRSVSSEDTFERDLLLGQLDEAIRRLADKTWTASRRTDRVGRTVVLKLKTDRFRILTRSHTPEVPPASAEELTAIALALRERVDLPQDTRYRLAGVGLAGFRDREEVPAQPALFETVGNVPTQGGLDPPSAQPHRRVKTRPTECSMSFSFSAVLFDLDGTLVDSASDIAEAVNRLLDDEGLPRAPEALIRTWIGEGATALLATALRHAGSSRPVEELMPRFMVHYGDCLLLQPRLYPGVAETLDALVAMKVPLAVCTNKPEAYAAPLIEHMGIADRFQRVVAAGTLSERKPHPLPLLHLADALGAAPDRCLMVGDSETDFLAARAAGMPVVLVSYGYRRDFDLRAAGALAVIDRFNDLLSL